MGKAKKHRVQHHSSRPYSKSALTSVPNHKHNLPTPASIPFDPSNRILLVGEGNFSFSHSLLEHHACTFLVATCLDSQSALLEKYPQAAAHIAALEAEDGTKVLYGVDATKLGKPGGGGKEMRRVRGFDRIVFNFPHVGGLTKDVNRQVRHNQELLVGFFKSAAPLLAPSGSIILTLFEGEPYELWNVRDLSRHVGLKVGMSFRFQSGVYPGYEHARTVGNIKGDGGWKGEERAARTYIFEIKDGEELQIPSRCQREREDSENEDDG